MSACDSAIRGQVRAGLERLGGLAWKVHRDQWPPLADRAEVALDQLGHSVDVRACQS